MAKQATPPNFRHCGALILALLLAWPAASPAEDLMTIYRLALQNDPRFLAARATHLAEREKFPQARAGLLPEISASAGKSRNDIERVTDQGIVSSPAGKAEYISDQYSLSLSQPLYNHALFSGLRQARAEVRRAEAGFAAAGQDLLVRAAESYFEALAAADNLELSRAEKTAIARQLELANGRLEVGLTTITDVHDARARFELAEAQEIEAGNRLADSQEALRETSGRAPEDLARLGRNVPLVAPDPPMMEKWVEKALEQNLALIARRETVEIARAEIKRNRAGHLPTLDLVGSHARTDTEGSITGPDIRSDNTTVGLELTVPLVQGGLVNSLTREAVHRYEAARQELETESRAAERAVRAAYLGVNSGASKVTALKQAVIASQSALDAKKEGYEAGINTNLDVLDAQRDLFRARSDYAEARYAYIISLLQLKRAAGILAEDDLAQVNAWLE